MNEEENKADKVEATPEPGVDGAENRGSCTPPCTLYRWYPPLLVLSTVMAGVFCVLYVSKPVFLEAPNQNLPDPLNVPVYAEQIADADVEPTRGSGKALMPVHLDPDLLAAPREPVAQDPNPGGPPPVAELKPMQVRKPSKSLFKPMNPDEMPPVASPKAIAVEPAPPVVAEEAADPEGGEARAVAVTEPVEDSPPAEELVSPMDEVVAMASPEELEAVQEDLADHGSGHPTDDPGDEFEGDVVAGNANEVERIEEEFPRIVMRGSVLGEFYSTDGTHEAGAGASLGGAKVIALQEE